MQQGRQAGRLGNSVSEVNMHRGILTKIKKFHTLHSRPNENQGELRSKSGDAKWIHPLLLQCVVTNALSATMSSHSAVI